MATIEPRLIHLLNESTTPQLPHADLPPLHSLPLPKASDRLLPPLEPDASDRGDRLLAADASAVASPAGRPLYIGAEDTAFDYRKDGSHLEGKHAGIAATFPLRLLLGEPDTTESSYSLNKILDDSPDVFDDHSNKKRHRGLHVKDDFVQLPQPLKKQKATQQSSAMPPMMPPIINGLHEPPPHAALFPPISSDSFDHKDGSQMKILRDFNQPAIEPDNSVGNNSNSGGGGGGGSGSSSSSSNNNNNNNNSNNGNNNTTATGNNINGNKARKRATKPRRKWSEEETKHLLLGVNRHGVGKWTSILEDTEFRFNDRTAGDLKDRFRTCCPDELRKSGKQAEAGILCPVNPRPPKQKAKAGSHLDMILIDSDDATAKDGDDSSAPPDTTPTSKQKRSRAHRKNMDDLAELGIHGPFKKSHRRERRPFTEQDDREILEGLNYHGPAWTKIQRDRRFNLSGRQPTDLRDRVRNKYPSIYQRIEKGTFQVQDVGRSTDIMEPTISVSIDNSLKPSNATMEPHMNRLLSRDELPWWPMHRPDPNETSYPTQSFDFGETTVPQVIVGEMDISRLLLDDARLS